MSLSRTFIRPLSRGLTRPLVGGIGAAYLDPAVAAFAATTGATDLDNYKSMVAWLRAQNLYEHIRFFSAKPDQNIGTGSTIYMMGGWGSDNLTIFNGAPWATNGIDLGATQHISGEITGLGSQSRLLHGFRQRPDLASVADQSNGIVSGFGRFRTTTPTGTGGWNGIGTTGVTSGEIISNGFTKASDTSDGFGRLGSNQGSWTAGEDFAFNFEFANTGFSIWKNKTSISLNVNNIINSSYPSAPSNLGGVDGVVYLGAVNINGSVAVIGGRGVVTSGWWCKTALTQAQRETLTDFINAF